MESYCVILSVSEKASGIQKRRRDQRGVPGLLVPRAFDCLCGQAARRIETRVGRGFSWGCAIPRRGASLILRAILLRQRQAKIAGGRAWQARENRGSRWRSPPP
jgi:hypothetical protein